MSVPAAPRDTPPCSTPPLLQAGILKSQCHSIFTHIKPQQRGLTHIKPQQRGLFRMCALETACRHSEKSVPQYIYYVKALQRALFRMCRVSQILKKSVPQYIYYIKALYRALFRMPSCLEAVRPASPPRASLQMRREGLHVCVCVCVCVQVSFGTVLGLF